MSTPALRVLAAVRAGAHPVIRPRSSVVHLYRGPLTPSGRHIPRAGRTVCRVRTSRLHVLEETPGGALELGGRRFCRRCTSSLGLDVQRLVSREEWAAAYSHLTLTDLITAARWARTVAETYTVSTVASIVLGGPHTGPVNDVLLPRRRYLEAAERTPEEIAAVERAREAQHYNDELVRAARRRSDAMDRAIDRRATGRFLTSWERELLDTPA